MPGRRREPLPGAGRRPSRPASTASTTSSSWATPYPRNAYEATDVPRIPSTLVEAIDELRGSTVAARGLRARRAPPPAQHGGAGVGGLQPPRHRTGSWPATSSASERRAARSGRRRAGKVARSCCARNCARPSRCAPPRWCLGRPVAAAVGRGARTSATSCCTARCGSGSSSPRRCASADCWPRAAAASVSASARSPWWRCSPAEGADIVATDQPHDRRGGVGLDGLAGRVGGRARGAQRARACARPRTSHGGCASAPST